MRNRGEEQRNRSPNSCTL